MTLCVIPARGGSKRIPHKNIKSFYGKPMIVWSIQAALDTGIFDKIIVSTDDPAIAQIAQDAGADVPFLRPAHLSDDHTPTAPVVAHAIETAETTWGIRPEHVCCLYATAPFAEADDIISARDVLISAQVDFAFPVTSYAFPIQRAVRLKSDGCMEMLHPEHLITRSQDLEDVYHDVGQFYWGQREAWIQNKPVMGSASAPFVIPRHRAQDIDTPEDWTRAEQLFALSSKVQNQ